MSPEWCYHTVDAVCVRPCSPLQKVDGVLIIMHARSRMTADGGGGGAYSFVACLESLDH